jgi:hypothetical protein
MFAPSAAKARDVDPRRPARLDVHFPRPICHDQGDFWGVRQNLQRSIRTRVIIGDYRIDVLADIVSVSGRISASLRTRVIPIKKSAYDRRLVLQAMIVHRRGLPATRAGHVTTWQR